VFFSQTVHMCILIVFVCYAYCVGICEYLELLATVRAREFWMCWSLFIWVL